MQFDLAQFCFDLISSLYNELILFNTIIIFIWF